MISHLSGKVILKNEKSVVIETNGVGYKVFMTDSALEKIKEGATVGVWTHFSVREDSQALYGFLEKEELNFFELLVSFVPGIGPKTALNILNVSPVSSLKKAVSTGDTAHLTKVSGIGKKVADKIVLELKGKFGAEDGGGVLPKDEADAIDALKSLGFGHAEAREALKEVGENITNTGERIKKALKLLGK